MFRRLPIASFVGFVGIVALCTVAGYTYVAYSDTSNTAQETPAYKTPAEENLYVRFDMEIFDIVMKEYWQKITEADLAEVYRLALAKARGTSEEKLPAQDRTGVSQMLGEVFVQTAEEKRKPLAVDIGIIVLANLPPQGRSGLLSEKQEKELRNNANNINPDRNLYATLGVNEQAPTEAVQKAYEEKKAELTASTSPAAKEVLTQVNHAAKVLTDVHAKNIYDQTKIEPSVVSRVIGGKTLYVDLAKVTPATFDEFVRALEKTKEDTQLTGLIIDVRRNIGGSLDFAKYLFALFVGPNQYAFDLFRKEEFLPERTPRVAAIPSLNKLSDIVILTDRLTQSTAELTTVIFKRFNLATIVGRTTRGWGTVENTYPVTTQLSDDEKYSVFIVNHVTLREDNEPIEGRGVEPHISIDTPSWQKELRVRVSTSGFADAVILVLNE